ncbi:hypothetical protein TD95_005336 [Thielaviopsis punctulata]|uniref:Major facilitator superfamily (MFS) profile domain-containing protein n=1 Tax=Thielaviopsis punctulata TaxID=72032 RepID=A0A0F4ZGM9_9PEZI|nr:hypothetical protein TD95_005336 [Thielaviopsis punctulata]
MSGSVAAPHAPVKWRDLPHRTQLIVITLARLSEPLSYMFYQLKWFDPSLPDSTISAQAGILHASFTAAQFLTAMLWGRIADSAHAGRKTVLLIGLLGTCASCIGFGFARTFPQALAFRLLGGVTNGNVGVMRTMIGEIVRDKRFQPRAFLLLPMCFNIGVIVGPVLGGLLADPARSWPAVFGGLCFFETFPYATPNLLSGAFLLSSALLVWFFLDETLDTLRDQPPDVGIRIGQAIRRFVVRLYHRWRPEAGYAALPTEDDDEDLTTDVDEELATDGPLSTLPKNSSGASSSDTPSSLPPARPQRTRYTQRLAFRRIFTPNVLCVLASNFILALHVGTFNPLWVIFLSTPVYDPSVPNHGLPTGPHLPVRFTGGLGLTPKDVGFAMGVIGMLGLPLQLLVYAPLSDRVGPLRALRGAVLCFPLAYLLIPYLAVIPSTSSAPHAKTGVAVWMGIVGVLVVQVLGRTFGLPSQTVLVNSCSPHPSVLGTIHGLGQSVSSGARTVGPMLAGWIYGVGLNHGMVGLVWWCLCIVAIGGVVATWFVREGDGHEIWLEGDEE